MREEWEERRGEVLGAVEVTEVFFGSDLRAFFIKKNIYQKVIVSECGIVQT